MYAQLQEINKRPKPFEFYTAEALWADPYTSEQMLAYHLNTEIDVASRNSAFIGRSVEWIISAFSITDQSSICDFGCGPGLYTSALAKSGADVTGIDFSKHSIDYARGVAKKEALDIKYVHQNYLEYESDKSYDLITMIMCDFSALSPAQRKQLLEKFHKLLNDKGAVLLDVYSLRGYDSREENAMYEHLQLNGFWSPNDYYGFVNTFKYDDEKVVLDKYTIVEEQGSKIVYNWLQYFSVEALKEEFERCGFTIKALYDDVSGTEYSDKYTEFAVIAVKNS